MTGATSPSVRFVRTSRTGKARAGAKPRKKRPAKGAYSTRPMRSAPEQAQADE